MREITFRVELLTDIVLNQRAATQGSQESLDFIPGSNFLGIVASKLYPDNDENIPEEVRKENFILFHSGKVRFGDAHPAVNNARTLRIPASFYYAKLAGDTRVLIHHKMPQEDNIEISKFEPKQFRSGFYNLSDLKNENIHLCAIKADIKKTFAIKSAYDREMRRSADSQMYGYESLMEGSLWELSVFVDEKVDDHLIAKVKKELSGQQRIGRSRTAQYGLIDIREIKEAEKRVSDKIIYSKDFLLIYADARLIFLDEFGLPTFQPTEEQLYIKNGKINWQKSQIRTFQYAPWNYKRQARDADRCGIEKGSVFYIEQVGKVSIEQGNEFVGTNQNEGFGKILVNPTFLESKGNVIGESLFFKNTEKEAEMSNSNPDITCYDNPVFRFLKRQHDMNDLNERVYNQVNEFIEEHKNRFSEDDFASQWGHIHSLALQYSAKLDRNEAMKDYISNGVAKEKWEKYGRFDIFSNFIAELDEKSSQLILVNLAREMAKIKKGK